MLPSRTESLRVSEQGKKGGECLGAGTIESGVLLMDSLYCGLRIQGAGGPWAKGLRAFRGSAFWLLG